MAQAYGDKLCRQGRFDFFWGEIAFRPDEDQGSVGPSDTGQAGSSAGRFEQVSDIGLSCSGLSHRNLPFRHLSHMNLPRRHLGEQLGKWNRLGKDRQPGLLGLKHGADEDIAQSVCANGLPFGAFAEQGDDGTDADLGSFFQEPFETGGVLDGGDGDRDAGRARRFRCSSLYGNPAFLLVIIEDHGIEQGTVSVGQPKRFAGAHPQYLDNVPGIVFVQHDLLLTGGKGGDIEKWECH